MKGKNLLITCFFIILFLISWTMSFAEDIYPFSGELDLAKEDLRLKVDLKDKGSVDLKIAANKSDQFSVFLKAEHLVTPFFDLSSEINSTIISQYDGVFNNYKGLSGKVWSQYTLLNYKPVNELSCQFEIKDRKLKLSSFTFGSIVLNGYLDLFSPYTLNFTVKLSSIDMDDFLNFWVSNKGYDSSGGVYGIIKASGNLNRLFLEGNLQSQDGFIKTLNYNTVNLKVQGFYPKMEIYDSTISKDDGTSFMFSGPFDIADRKNFKKQIMLLTLAPIVSNKNEEMKWTIKRLKDKNEDSTVELKYLLKQDSSDGVSGKGATGLLGVEKVFKF